MYMVSRFILALLTIFFIRYAQTLMHIYYFGLAALLVLFLSYANEFINSLEQSNPVKL